MAENSYLRAEYPILKTKNYLASHSLGAVPFSTQVKLSEYYQAWASEGILAWDTKWGSQIKIFTTLIEQLLGAPSGSVVPLENVTRGFQAIASCWNWEKISKNEIVLTDLEFSTAYPFWKGLEKLGAKIIIISSDDGMTVPAQKIISALSHKTILVVTSHVYFRSGSIQKISALSEAAHQFGAYMVCDGYQAAGTIPVNVNELGVDFYVGGSHKWLCGGAGAGYMYVHPKVSLTPLVSGWFGLKDPFRYEPSTELELSGDVNRFMMGTPAIPALFAAEEGLRNVLKVGASKVREHSIQLTEQIIEESKKRGWKIKTPLNNQDRSGMVCVSFSGDEALTEKLVQLGTIVDWRPNCGIRLSPHFYNESQDIEVFFKRADELLK